MAKQDKEFRDVYWVSVKEYYNGLRPTLKREVYETLGGAFKKYEELILEYKTVQDKKLIVDIVYIHEGRFYTIKERRLWDDYECRPIDGVLMLG